MMRAVLALLCLLEGATCRVTRREGQVPPSKTIKKVDCGGWNHPDSEENTRTTVYGKIGMACLDRKKSSSDHFWGEPGTGFDDDTPPIELIFGTSLVRTATTTTSNTQTRTCAGTSTSTKPTWGGTSPLHTFFQLVFSS